MSDRLIEILASMTLPQDRKRPADRSDLEWLGRNMFWRNRQHPDLPEARNLLRTAGVELVL